MPTPFMHLQLAERLLAHPDLLPAVRAELAAHWPAFYLGSVAADVQTITKASRASTHFYDVPPATDIVAYDHMLQAHPELADVTALPADQAVFVAAYRAHLLADIGWFWDIAFPYFIEPDDWPASYRRRFVVHNMLLAFLDNEALAALPAGAGGMLAAAAPADWLPFVADPALCQWRDMLVEQLQPGAPVATIAIYAERLGMAAAEFGARLADADWMAERVFRRVPLAAVRDSSARVLEESVALVNDYLSSF